VTGVAGAGSAGAAGVGTAGVVLVLLSFVAAVFATAFFFAAWASKNRFPENGVAAKMTARTHTNFHCETFMILPSKKHSFPIQPLNPRLKAESRTKRGGG
jgi:hypothetical protein